MKVKFDEWKIGDTRTVVRRVVRGQRLWLDSNARAVVFSADALVPVHQKVGVYIGLFDRGLTWKDVDVDLDGVVPAPPTRWQRLRRWIWSRLLGGRPVDEPIGELPVARTIEACLSGSRPRST